MTSAVILDTSAFISLENIDDSNYQKATQISKKLSQKGSPVIVPGEIFTEIVNVVGKKVGHQAAIKQANKILNSQSFTISETNINIRQMALEKFQKQPKSVSFTDCIVMVFADEYETKEIFGFDDAFRKNGYVRFGIDKQQPKLPK